MRFRQFRWPQPGGRKIGSTRKALVGWVGWTSVYNTRWGYPGIPTWAWGLTRSSASKRAIKRALLAVEYGRALRGLS